MTKKPALTRYQQLLADILFLYQKTRQSVVQFYWETGKRIVEVEQGGASKAVRGSGLIQKLSADLCRRCGPGSGFSGPNLRRMRQFYLSHPNCSAPNNMTWTQNVELLGVKDERLRARLEKQAAQKGLGSREIRALVREAQPVEKSVVPIVKKFPPLKPPTDLKLFTYQKLDEKDAAVYEPEEGGVLLDGGFFVELEVSKEEFAQVTVTDKPSYTYAARVARVVDGDTLVVVISLGRRTRIRPKLRLRGIDTPELGTPEGEQAKKYVQKLLPVGTPIILKSHKTDTHGRFVADVFFKTGAESAESILPDGIYLNQHLLDAGYAVRAAE